MAIERPLAPQPTGGQLACSYSDGRIAKGWRWYKAMRAWQPVCDSHTGGGVVASAGSYVPDFATRVPREPEADQPTSFTCPRCEMTSYHPGDVAAGYCGNCHDYTGGKRAADTIEGASNP